MEQQTAEQKFVAMVSEHQGILLKVCRMYCTDPDDAEDLFQEVLLQLWRSYPHFMGGAKASTWMYRIGLNTAITRLRQNKRKPLTQALAKAQFNLSETETTRLDLVLDQELQQAINCLNKFDRALLMLYLDEKSYKEMAEIMGITEQHIGVKINRIKKKLKETLNA